MRETRLSGLEGGVALTVPSLPLSYSGGFAALGRLLTVVRFAMAYSFQPMASNQAWAKLASGSVAQLRNARAESLRPLPSNCCARYSAINCALR